MFITYPRQEWSVPRGLVPDSGRCWQAVEVSTRAPWFMVTLRVPSEGLRLLHTIALAWETTLMSFIGELTAESIAAIQLVAPLTDGTGEWELRRVKALWIPAKEEAPETGPLLFSFADCDDVYDCHQRRVSHTKLPRELLFQQRD